MRLTTLASPSYTSVKTWHKLQRGLNFIKWSCNERLEFVVLLLCTTSLWWLMLPIQFSLRYTYTTRRLLCDTTSKHQAVSGTPAFLETRRLIRMNDVNVFCTVLLFLLLLLFLILLIFSTHFLSYIHYIPYPFYLCLLILVFLLKFQFLRHFLSLLLLAPSSLFLFSCFSSYFLFPSPSFVFPLLSRLLILQFLLQHLHFFLCGAVTPTPSWILTCCWTAEHVTTVPCATLSSSGPLLLIPNVSLKLSDTWPSFFL